MRGKDGPQSDKCHSTDLSSRDNDIYRPNDMTNALTNASATNPHMNPVVNSELDVQALKPLPEVLL